MAEVLVAEGQAVEAGQVLLRLDGARQRAAVAGAEAALARAKAHLDELEVGARDRERSPWPRLRSAAPRPSWS